MKITKIIQSSLPEVFVIHGRYPRTSGDTFPNRVLTSIVEDIKTVAWGGGQPIEEIRVYRCLDQDGKTIVELEANSSLIIYKEDDNV